MTVKNIKKHSGADPHYTGELGDTKVYLTFEDEATPTEGDINVLLGKLVTKNNLNCYYIRKYEGVKK